MKIRTKIALILIPIALLTIIAVHFAFGTFFMSYLEEREEDQASFIYTSLVTFISERENKYIGIANDWGHWDDTYLYVGNQNPDYIEKNLNADTFENLDVNFIAFIREDGSITSFHYYDFSTNNFSQRTETFLDQFLQSFEISTLQAVSGIFQLDNSFYFVASCDITDSTNVQPTIGNIIIGRLMDEGILADMEAITGCTIGSINLISEPYSGPEVSLSRDRETMILECAIPHNQGTTVYILSKARDLFLSGMNQYRQNLYLSLVIIVVLIFTMFCLLGVFMSKPLLALTGKVKGINLAHQEMGRISIDGSDEFAFLGQSINSMLDVIDEEHNKVRESEGKLYATLSSVGDGVIAVDSAGMVQFLNPVAEKLTGWTQHEALGRDMNTVFHIINEYTREPVDCPVKAVFETQRIIELANHTLLIAKDGSERSIEDTAAPIRDASDRIVGCVLVFRDSSEKKEKQRRIEYLSYHDQLTGLYNRRFFEEEIKRLDTRRNLPITFAYADINGLKAINDAFGHHKGDQLIQKVSNVFLTECRADDIIARTGGDEFIIMLPRTDSDAAEKLVKRIHSIIEKKKVMNINISISFGWETKSQENQSAWDVLKKAENSMYQKKLADNTAGRNHVINTILSILKQKSPLEEAHSQRVGSICQVIGKAYGLTNEEIAQLRTVGEYHDIGKITMDESILGQAGDLSENEWAQMKNHPEIGYRLLSASSEFYSIAEWVLAHHERWDGSGYPKGLKGKVIPFNSRIIAIADAYDTMTSEWPYKKSLSKQEAVREIKKNAGSQFDPQIARVFVEKILGIPWNEA